jgi:hypothetical protein
MDVSTDLMSKSKDLLAVILLMRSSNGVSNTNPLQLEAQPRAQAVSLLSSAWQESAFALQNFVWPGWQAQGTVNSQVHLDSGLDDGRKHCWWVSRY